MRNDDRDEHGPLARLAGVRVHTTHQLGTAAGELGAVHGASLSLFRALAIGELDEAERACGALILLLSQAERDLTRLEGPPQSAAKGQAAGLAFRRALIAAVREVLVFVRHAAAPDVTPLVPRHDWSLFVQDEITGLIHQRRRVPSIPFCLQPSAGAA